MSITVELTASPVWFKIASVALAGCSIGVGLWALRRYIWPIKYARLVPMSGKTVVITGANTGIGYAAAKELVSRNARVILACRDMEAAVAAQKSIRNYTKNGEVVVKYLDLASLSSVRNLAREIVTEEDKLDVLINNAGVFQCPLSMTTDGFERQMGVNHLGHFLLTNLLLEKLKESVPSRVVIVSSALHKRGSIDFDNFFLHKGYNKSLAYSNSKLANNLFARSLAAKVQNSGVSVYCLHPGMVATRLDRYISIPAWLRFLLTPFKWILLKSPLEGCQTVLHCATEPDVGTHNGFYYGNCTEESWNPKCLEEDAAEKLWTLSENLTDFHTRK